MTQPLSFERFCSDMNVSRETGAKYRTYLALLEKWQNKINLVGADTLKDPWRRHFLDSAQLHPHMLVSRSKGQKPNTTRKSAGQPVVVDLGSGAGFPGLVIAILGDLTVHLIESDQRKCAFLHEVIRETNSNAFVHNARIEQVEPSEILGPDLADYVTARACARLERLLGLAQPFLSRNGSCLFLKGAKVAEELTDARKSWNITSSRIASMSHPSGIVLSIKEISRDET